MRVLLPRKCFFCSPLPKEQQSNSLPVTRRSARCWKAVQQWPKPCYREPPQLVRSSWPCSARCEHLANYVTIAVEGRGDVAIVRRILGALGCDIHRVHGQRGKSVLDRSISGYNNAAQFSPWLVVRDLNSDEPCAGALVSRLLPNAAPQMRFRIAVCEAESWLLADAERICKFLKIAQKWIPDAPEALEDPKRELVTLANRSRSRKLREDMVPAPGTTAKVGPAYVSRISEFASRYWRPRVAATRSESLRRCMTSLEDWAAE